MTPKTRGEMMLSKRFSHDQMMHLNKTANHKIANMPDQTQINNFNNLHRNILEPLRQQFDAIVSGLCCYLVHNVSIALLLNVSRKCDDVNQNIILKDYTTNH